MAKDRKKLQHMHSSIPDKQPTPASLEVGEIAVNNAAEQEFLSVKNTDNKVVRFSSDGQIIEWIERKEVMPYKGYVRGEGGPTTTSGDTPVSDDKGSYGVTNKNLLENKSQLVFKLNQVAADLTTKHDKVNGADDMFGEEINPTDDYGVNDGAGFFIDMSRYAMIDANPSFSALTATCQTRLSGNTYISDGASANTYGTDTGHTLDIKVTNNVVSGVTWDETLSAKTENISGRTTTIGNDGENLHVIGKTVEVHDDDVTITNKSDVTVVTSGNSTTTISGNTVENHSGTTVENKLGNVTENTTGTTTINNTGKTTVNVVHGTEINSCEGISANTNIFIVKQCSGERGKAEFDFCSGFTVNSDDVKITECTPDGSIVITEKNATVNAENTTINDRGNTVINTSGNSSANTTGNVVVNTTGTTTIDRNGNVSENNQHNVTVVTSGNNTTTISGNAITNVSGNTTADTSGNVVVMTSGTTTETKGGNVTENNQSNKTENTTGNVIVNTTGTTTETKGGIVTENNLSDKTENTTGDHSLYVTGNTCVTSQKTARFYGKVNTEIGVACNGTPASATSVIGTDTLKMSGTTTTLSANSTTITSCGDVTINTNVLKVEQCSDSGSAEFDFCKKFTVNSDDVNITECSANGSLTITEKEVKINAENTVINDSGDTTINTTDDLSVNTTGDTTLITSGSTTIKTEDGTTIQTTAGDANINTTGDTNITSTDDICAVADKTAAFVGTVKTNIGKNCADGGQTKVLNINGDTINITGGTISAYTSGKTCVVANTDLNLGGNTNTRIGSDCAGNPFSDNVYVSATTLTEVKSPTITLSGNTTNITGATNVNIKGNDICISGGTEASMGANAVKVGTNCDGTTIATGISAFSTNNVTITSQTINESGTSTVNIYGGDNVNVNSKDVCIIGTNEASMGAKTVNVGTDCGGSMIAATINISGTTINEGGTTNNNNFTTINNTATTINNNTTNYNITGTTNIDGDTTVDGNLTVTENTYISGDTYIDGTLHLTKGIEKKLYFQTGTTDVSQSPYDGHEDRTITIPSCVSHLDRKTLSWSLGKPSAGNYDPGDAACSGDEPFKIPSSLKHLTEWNNGCLEVDGCLKATAVYSTSDERAKENIERANYGKACFARDVEIKQFNLKSDESKRMTYGVIAQDVISHGLEELVYINSEGLYAVDYTSLMILKIRYLENELEALRHKISQLENKEQ